MGCSQPDLNSTNEMHRVHMKGDKRCGETNIEKPDLEDKGKKSSSEDDMGTKKKSPSKEDYNESTNSDGFQAPKKRILIFTTMILMMLCRFAKWSMDGTFKAAPVLWGQIVIIMGKVGPVWIPVCYCLLPDKEKYTYFIFLLMIKKNYVEQEMKVKF